MHFNLAFSLFGWALVVKVQATGYSQICAIHSKIESFAARQGKFVQEGAQYRILARNLFKRAGVLPEVCLRTCTMRFIVL